MHRRSAFALLPLLAADEPVGTLTLDFADGENATFSYTIGSVSQSKPLTRLQFGSTSSVCASFSGTPRERR